MLKYKLYKWTWILWVYLLLYEDFLSTEWDIYNPPFLLHLAMLLLEYRGPPETLGGAEVSRREKSVNHFPLF